MMFCFRTIHLVFGLILIGAVKAVPMPPSGTTSKSPEPPLDYYNYMNIGKKKEFNPKYIRSTPDIDKKIRLEIYRGQQNAYRQSGWIQVTIYFETKPTIKDKLRTMKNELLKLLKRVLKWPKGSPSPDAARNLMLKEEAGVSEERESMLRESIQRWSGREVPWDKALGVQVIYEGGLEPGADYFHYYVSWVHGEPPAKVDPNHGSIGELVFIQLYRELPKGWYIDIDH
ncbi:hypothetical protein EV360DRAFT_80095 [Lentinula raphanica]|nr:hypothetical protein EV360DRAFT_80095 [Lentinula raphanica]